MQSFTPVELQLVTDFSFFKSKKIITDKIYADFAKLIDAIAIENNRLQISFPPNTDTSTGKISRGENYLNLPWVMCDFPKLFSTNGVFAFRTMFWWGQHVSYTLHLSGNCLKMYEAKVVANFSSLKQKNIFMAVGKNEWVHEISSLNYISVDEIDFEILKQQIDFGFLKFAKKFKPDAVNDIVENGKQAYLEMMEVINPFKV